MIWDFQKPGFRRNLIEAWLELMYEICRSGVIGTRWHLRLLFVFRFWVDIMPFWLLILGLRVKSFEQCLLARLEILIFNFFDEIGWFKRIPSLWQMDLVLKIEDAFSILNYAVLRVPLLCRAYESSVLGRIRVIIRFKYWYTDV